MSNVNDTDERIDPKEYVEQGRTLLSATSDLTQALATAGIPRNRVTVGHFSADRRRRYPVNIKTMDDRLVHRRLPAFLIYCPPRKRDLTSGGAQDEIAFAMSICFSNVVGISMGSEHYHRTRTRNCIEIFYQPDVDERWASSVLSDSGDDERLSAFDDLNEDC